MNSKVKTQIKELEEKLTGNMLNDMDIKDEIHKLEMADKGVKPEDSHFDCIGCSG